MVTGVLFGVLTCLCPFATGLLLYLLSASFFRKVVSLVESQNVDFHVHE
jgi:hypothetical protein